MTPEAAVDPAPAQAAEEEQQAAGAEALAARDSNWSLATNHPSRRDSKFGVQPAQSLGAVAWRCWPLLVGNLLEWYDYGIYGYLAAQIKANFFPSSELATWLGYAVTFAARPLGGVLLGWVADRFGRRVSLNISIYGMLIATVGQGLLPTYLTGSHALGCLGLALLMLFRLLQGLSAGGEVTTIDAYFLEVSPLKHIGLMVSLIAVNGNFATFLANGAAALMASIMGPEQMMQWGWRVPFLLALPPGLLAAWGRRSFPESELFVQERDGQGSREAPEAELEAPSPAEARRERSRPQAGGGTGGGLRRSHVLASLLCIGGTLTNATCRNVATTWCVAHLQSRGLDPRAALWAGTLANAVSLVLPPAVGWLTDVQGVGWVTCAGAAAYALLSPLLFALLSAYPADPAVALLGLGLGFGALLALTSATFHLFCAELFPTAVRARGLGFAYNAGQIVFGGFGPLVAEASLQLTPAGPALYMALSGLLTAGTVLLGLQLQRLGLVRLAHRRPRPYFGEALAQEAKAAAARGAAKSAAAGPPGGGGNSSRSASSA